MRAPHLAPSNDPEVLAELWLLNLVVECLYPVHAIREQEVAWHFRTYHGLSNRELVPVFYQLFAQGDLIAFEEAKEREFVPDLDTVEAAVMATQTSNPFRGDPSPGDYGPDFLFRLTPQGGARWEAAFTPDWSRYVEIPWPDEQGDVELTGGSRAAVELYLAACGIDAGSLTGDFAWESVSPWKATYWKTLPLGHCCRFRLPEGAEEALCESRETVTQWSVGRDGMGVFAEVPALPRSW